MPFYDFKRDFPIAKKTEKEVGGILEKLYGAEILDYENTYRYDILTTIEDKHITFEVKEDFLCEYTGNVGLEYECRGKPSGIQTSESDYYIYKVHTKGGIKFILHKTSILKDMIENKSYFRIVNGGDKGSNSMNYLFKYDVFLETGKLLDLDKNQQVWYNE